MVPLSSACRQAPVEAQYDRARAASHAHEAIVAELAIGRSHGVGVDPDLRREITDRRQECALFERPGGDEPRQLAADLGGQRHTADAVDADASRDLHPGSIRRLAHAHNDREC